MPPKGYNFFGLGPGQMQPSQDPALLAQQMALQQYNNPTSSQSSQGGGGMGGMDLSALAKMMMQPQSTPYTPSPNIVTNGSQTFNTGAWPSLGGGNG